MIVIILFKYFHNIFVITEYFNNLLLLDLNSYIERVQNLVNQLYQRVQKTQENVKRIRSILFSWAKTPVLCRKDCKKDTLLAIDDREERILKR